MGGERLAGWRQLFDGGGAASPTTPITVHDLTATGTLLTIAAFLLIEARDALWVTGRS